MLSSGSTKAERGQSQRMYLSVLSVQRHHLLCPHRGKGHNLWRQKGNCLRMLPKRSTSVTFLHHMWYLDGWHLKPDYPPVCWSTDNARAAQLGNEIQASVIISLDASNNT